MRQPKVAIRVAVALIPGPAAPKPLPPAHGSVTLRERRGAAGSDPGAHDPPPLRDLPYPREAVSGIQLLRSCVQIGATLRRPLPGLLRIGLDDAAAGPLDLVECRPDRHGGKPHA